MLDYISGVSFIEYTSWQIMNSGFSTYKYYIAESIFTFTFLFLLYSKYLNSKTIKMFSKLEIFFALFIIIVFILSIADIRYSIWNAGVLMVLDNNNYGYNQWFGFVTWIIILSGLLYLIIIGNLEYFSKMFYVERGKLYVRKNKFSIFKLLNEREEDE